MTTVGQLMRLEIRVIGEEASVQTAAQEMFEKNIGSLLVEKDGGYSGIITESDFIQAVAQHPNLAEIKVKDIMSCPIISVDQTCSPPLARDMMADRRIRHLAVTKEGTIAGIISVRDLLAYFRTVSKEIV